MSFYARHFDTVEVNSTFYGQPRASVSASWVRRTPDHFEFSIKLYQKFTHPRMYRERLGRQLAAVTDPDASSAEAIAALATPTAADIDTFKRGIAPLAESGKLGALLAQFPPSFVFGDSQGNYLERLLRAFDGYSLAVELRHRSWSDQIGRAHV